MAEPQSIAAVLFLASMLVAWLITLFDPWIGIAVGVMVAIVAVSFLIAAKTEPASDRHQSSDNAFEDEER